METIVESQYSNEKYCLEDLEHEFGTVDYDGTKIWITQNPYIDDRPGMDGYISEGIDAEGYMYRITWPIINADAEDESDACDWNNYKISNLGRG